ncbi:MAG: Bug family tripartite tricarboxylate transporter substrate binding protein, partial [Lautropia sp.]
ALAVLIMPPAIAQPTAGGAAGYPNRPVRFVVPYGPGTSTDLQARFMAQKFGELTRQSVVVENKPGANAILGTQFALNAPADGYTLVVGGTTSHAGNKSLFKNLPYDPIKDFVAISGVAIGGGAFIVSPSFPAKTLPELVALARREPGKYSYGWASAFSRVAVENLLADTGVKMLHVPYKGSASLASEVMAGTIDLAFEPIVTLLPLIKSGKVRSLGVSTLKRAPGLEEVPSVAEQGVPNFQFLGWLCIFAKVGTPAPIVERLNELFVSILKTPEAADFFRQNAVWEPMIMTPAETARFVASEVELWKQGVERAGIEPQ